MGAWVGDKVLPPFNVGHTLSPRHLPTKRNSHFSAIPYSTHLQNLQHFPLDDNLLRIYLVKTLPRINLVGKNQWLRKKSTVFLWTFGLPH